MGKLVIYIENVLGWILYYEKLEGSALREQTFLK